MIQSHRPLEPSEHRKDIEMKHIPYNETVRLLAVDVYCGSREYTQDYLCADIDLFVDYIGEEVRVNVAERIGVDDDERVIVRSAVAEMLRVAADLDDGELVEAITESRIKWYDADSGEFLGEDGTSSFLAVPAATEPAA
ncbi:MAG TPA: hypothetical protein VGN93_04390 [Shinella sp.]|jgi:hypothetical protein|uniref:hypothetical protein n=1 Tax=Shinella sp. TaxID=1870904 RepID=UPI002E12BC98|nr:hypothetical protein [Shinella sp.]